MIGSFSFVLHSHLPYARQAGRWPHGEEWVHEALTETYIPLLNGLYDLRDEGVPYKLTIGLTPVLLEQLADELIKDNFEHFIAEKVERSESDTRRFESSGDSRLSVARFWLDFYRNVQESFSIRFKRDVVGAFADLGRSGHLDILTSAATHGYLPLLSRDSSIRGQLRTGKRSSERHIGAIPESIWLPECAYRPAYQVNGVLRPPVEAFLSEVDISCFFVETHLVEGGRPTGKAAGDAVGPYGEIRRRYALPDAKYAESSATTFQPYLVGTSDVAVLARNNRTGLQVWSGDHGYPGDYWYREFHRKDGVSGLHYWRVSGASIELGEKEPYDPAHAFARTNEHADHFVALVRDVLTDYRQDSGRDGVVIAAYDTELFGHWWFEGVSWLTGVLRRLSADADVSLTSASDYVAGNPPVDTIDLPEGSWGQAGNHFTWLNADTEWMWPIIHEAEATMEEIAALEAPAQVETLNQAARELLLLQSSDWPFLVTTGQAGDYAVQRFLSHVDRFNELAGYVRSGLEAQARTADLYELDKVFPDIDYRDFAATPP
ncbi:MAG TPA: 1,4-alpha-glucan branching protein domain-containing protein [Dehalococcoidia bacterium]|nr:1,4-alpha-glucan branching protein domain-containing protein [Dehalococcoidia bacterium]